MLLEFDKVKYDNYNRILAYVYTLDGKFINAEIIKNGYAYLFPYPSEMNKFKVLLEAQRYAISN